MSEISILFYSIHVFFYFPTLAPATFPCHHRQPDSIGAIIINILLVDTIFVVDMFLRAYRGYVDPEGVSYLLSCHSTTYCCLGPWIGVMSSCVFDWIPDSLSCDLLLALWDLRF